MSASVRVLLGVGLIVALAIAVWGTSLGAHVFQLLPLQVQIVEAKMTASTVSPLGATLALWLVILALAGGAALVEYALAVTAKKSPAPFPVSLAFPTVLFFVALSVTQVILSIANALITQVQKANLLPPEERPHGLKLLLHADFGISKWIFISSAVIALSYVALRFLMGRELGGTGGAARGVRIFHKVGDGLAAVRAHAKRLKADGIEIHPNVRLPLGHESYHLLLVAAPGGGKTQVIFPLVERALARGDSLVVYDYKGDYTAAYGENPEALIFSPFDARSAAWDIARDVDTEQKAREFATALFPTDDTANAFWKRASADVLSTVIFSLQRERPKAWDFASLVHVLSSTDRIVAALEKHKPASLQSLGRKTDDPTVVVDGRLEGNVLADLRTGTIELEYLARAWKGAKVRFSVTDWVQQEGARRQKRLVIVQSHPNYQALDGLFTTQVFRMLIKATEALPESRQRRLWAFIDEFATLPKIPGIERLLEQARSKGLRIVCALQDIAQVERTYDKAMARSFFNAFGTHLIGAVRGETARFAAESFGKNETVRHNASQSVSTRSGAKGGSGHSRTKASGETSAVEQALLDTDFSNLPLPSLKAPAVFWFKISGWPVAKLTYKVEATPRRYPARVEAAWLRPNNEPTPPEAPQPTRPTLKKLDLAT